MKNEKNNNEINFNGTVNFNGSSQIASGDIKNHNLRDISTKASYTPEPKWRSPITMAILTWISVIIGIISIFPISQIAKSFMNVLGGNIQSLSISGINTYLFFVIGLMLLLVITITLRRITKKQTRVPLLFNYAISGNNKRLILEKISIDNCPQCGGKMKYYNKAIEWRDVVRSDGRVKREVIRKTPALECKRNANHWYEVDPAEDKMQ